MKIFLVLFCTLFSMVALADSPGAIGVRRSVGVPAALLTSTTNVTTSAWVQFVASQPLACSAVQLLNTGTSTIKIGFGASGSEVDAGEIFPNTASILVPMQISKGVRISVRAMDASETTGTLSMACFQ